MIVMQRQTVRLDSYIEIKASKEANIAITKNQDI